MADATPIHANSLPAESGCSYPEPFRTRMGQCTWQRLGDPFGLTPYYPADDLMWVDREDGSFPAHKDGTPYWLPGQKP